jgi:hypothetical protein
MTYVASVSFTWVAATKTSSIDEHALALLMFVLLGGILLSQLS